MGDKPRVRLLPVTENMMASEEKKKKKMVGFLGDSPSRVSLFQ